MSAAAIITDSSMSIADVFRMQNEVARQGEANETRGIAGYKVLGRMIELRHEVAKDANAPDVALAKKTGVVMDWRHYHNGPLVGLYPARNPQQVLVLSQVQPLPEIPDPDWKPAQMVEMAYGKVPAASLSAEEIKKLGIRLEDRPMVKQRFADHASGFLDKSPFLVVRPLTQMLYKMEGLQNFGLIDFASDVYAGTSPAFFINVENGEAHFHGGRFFIR